MRKVFDIPFRCHLSDYFLQSANFIVWITVESAFPRALNVLCLFSGSFSLTQSSRKMAHYKGAASEAGRAMQLMKKRELQVQEIEFRKKKIEEDLKINNIENKFASHYDAVEQQLKSSTIGLVTLDEMKAKQEDIVREREKKLAQKKEEKDREKLKALEAKEAEKHKQRKQVSGSIYSQQFHPATPRDKQHQS